MDIKNKTALHIIHDVCKLYPDNYAIIEDGCRTTTYAQLWYRARCISRFIDRHSISSHIGIELAKSSAYIETMLACWISGKAFVPIGNELPQTRKEYIITEAEIDLCINDALYRMGIESIPKDSLSYPNLKDEAYIIYSSGTTGKPKGIIVSHAGLGNLAKCQQKAFEVDESSRYLFFLSTNFDASISDILVTLTSGAALVIETDTSIDLSARLMDVIKERKVTHTDIPPSLLRLLSPECCPDTLRTIVIGGEAADIMTVRKWSNRLNLVNVYGPTEATVCTSLCKCTPEWEMPIIGKEIEDTQYYIFNEGKLNAKEGELWISGIGLAIGYLKNELLTERKFPIVDGKRYYRTGDRVRRTNSGDIEFIGRIDRQVKMHGQLIELEEIENVLSTLRLLKRVAVVKRHISQTNDNDILCAFVERANQEQEADTILTIIRKHLRHNLPHWMIPNYIKVVDRLPQTVTGKIDYPLLHNIELDLANIRKDIEYKYLNDEEKSIADIMADILKMIAIGPDDNFFDLGGDSLDCVILIAQLQNQLGKTITMAELKHNPTPRLINKLRQKEDAMCLRSEDLKDEWQIDFKLYPSRTDQLQGKNTLITGATGFLGAHILEKILSLCLSQKIYCLVRCANAKEGMERIIETFKRFGLSTKHLDMIEVVEGDICKHHLGIDNNTYRRLVLEVGTVFHCAASVNMLKSYDELKDTNVIGTKHVVDFCLEGCYKHLHYASTLSVFVATDRNSGIALETDLLETPTNIYGGYGQTKYVAEKIILSLPSSICKTTIYRFGLLCGSTITGISATKDFLGMFFRGARKIGSLPIDSSGSLAVDITPIDQAVDIITDIVKSKKAGIFHIASESPLSYNHLCRLMIQERLIEKMLPYKDWLTKAKEKTTDSDIQATIMSLCRFDNTLFKRMRYMDLFQTTNIRFDMTSTHNCTNNRCRFTDTIIIKYFK